MEYTQEEKKAIENLNEILTHKNDVDIFYGYNIERPYPIGRKKIAQLEIIKNLLEKQQNEIERLENKDKEYMKIENSNLEWQEKYNELKKKIENSKQFQVYISGMRSGKELLNKYINDSIPKNKIREKIKEIEDSLKEDCIALHEFQRLAKIDVLKEILGE